MMQEGQVVRVAVRLRMRGSGILMKVALTQQTAPSTMMDRLTLINCTCDIHLNQMRRDKRVREWSKMVWTNEEKERKRGRTSYLSWPRP